MEHPESYYNAYSLLKNYGSQNESISEVCQKIVEMETSYEKSSIN